MKVKATWLLCCATTAALTWVSPRALTARHMLTMVTKQAAGSSSSSSSSSNNRDVMKLPRVYLPSSQPLKLDTVIALSPDLGHYLANVMRLKVGQSFRAFNGVDGEYLCTLEAPSSSSSSTGNNRKSDRIKAATTSTAKVLHCLRPQHSDEDKNTARVVVYVAPLKKPRMKLLLEKVTELGVSSIVIVTTQNSEAVYDDDEALSSLQSVCIESAEQSERLTVPSLTSNVGLKLVAAHWATQRGPNAPAQPLFVCRERFAGGSSLLQVLLSDRNKNPDINSKSDTASPVVGLLIGPEGGFTQEEFRYMEALATPDADTDAGGLVNVNQEASTSAMIRFVTLGDGVLRAETAAISAVSVTMAALHHR